MTETVSSTLEDYLEAIAELSSEGDGARVGDIAARVGVHKSTVTAALRSLSEKGLINYAPYESATLTDSGRPIAEEVCRRHRILVRFLSDVLSLPQVQADANACRLEHAIDRPCLERLVCLVEYMDQSTSLSDWQEAFLSFCRERGTPRRGVTERSPSA